MAITKTAWSDRVGSDASKTSVGAGSTATSGVIDLNAVNPLWKLTVKAVVVVGATPDGNVEVQFVPHDADGAAEDDTENVALFTLDAANNPSTEIRRTVQVDVAGLDSCKVAVRNDDTVDSVDVWVSTMGAYPS